jgi:catechol 2,3-dioxygenase-like lactoylglutathione lyase family enzyme
MASGGNMPAKISTWAFVLAVQDLDRSAAWFRDVLGFRLQWEEGTDWRLAQRDGMRVMLGHCPNETPAAETGAHSWFGYLEVDDVDAFRAEIAARGAICSQPIDQSYGMREIMVTTVDGHRFVFGQQVSAAG